MHVKDWMSSATVRSMSPLERGIYCDLLCLQWLSNGAGIDPTIGALKRILGLVELHEELALTTVLEKCFFAHPENEKRVVNLRMHQDWKSANVNYQQKVLAGKKSGEARKRKEKQLGKSKRTSVKNPLELCSNEPPNGRSDSDYDSISSRSEENGLPSHCPPLPDSLDTPEVKAALREWETYKHAKGQRYKSSHGWAKLLKEYQPLGAAVFVRALNHSMANNYAGCFPPNGAARGGVGRGTVEEFKQNFGSFTEGK